MLLAFILLDELVLEDVDWEVLLEEILLIPFNVPFEEAIEEREDEDEDIFLSFLPETSKLSIELIVSIKEYTVGLVGETVVDLSISLIGFEEEVLELGALKNGLCLGKLIIVCYIFGTCTLHSKACFPTGGSGGVTRVPTTTFPGSTPVTVTAPPTTTVTGPTTTSNPFDCCPALVQTIEGVVFADGVLTLTYNSNTCRNTVSMFCSQPDPRLDLFAAIVVNTVNYMNYAERNVTWSATCSGGVWLTGDPPLTINVLQCLLTEPA
uniref:C6 domain-containing protein n=1 Tax=Rhabditophanes sp. KR3021 TaxID=114890 RepID=A0AC35U8E4_9BILA